MKSSFSAWTGRTLGKIPAPALFIGSGLGQYYGAALAVGLFAVMPAPTVAWTRTVVAALVLLAWRRPWRMKWTWAEFLLAVAFGVVLVAMNVFFYIAIDHLPLGTAVAIEFLGPVAVAAIGGRGFLQRSALVLATGGVLLISGFGLEWNDSTKFGLVMILTAGAAWAGYIILGQRVASRGMSRPGGIDGLTSLSVGMGAAALLLAPFVVASAAPVISSWANLAAAIGVGIFSSAIPYVIDQVNMRRLSAAAFALLSALLPATATVVGLVALQQTPNLAELGGLACVSLAVALTSISAVPRRKNGPKASEGDAL